MQLEISLIISQILAFLIMLWVLKKFAWKPLLKILNDRKNRIQAEFDAIDKQKNEIERLALVYKEKLENIEKESNQKISAAVEAGNKMAQKIQEEALQQAKEILAKTQKDLVHEINKAQIDLKNHLAEIVIQATQRLISEKMDSEKDKKLIMDFLDMKQRSE